MSVHQESALRALYERIQRTLPPRLGKIPLESVVSDSPTPEHVEYPIVERVHLDDATLREMENGNKAILAGVARDTLGRLELTEDELVFRSLVHPKGNITAELLARHGTDRFRGYGKGRLPQESEGLIPFRNQGETEELTADTYVVPSLEWALAFTTLSLPQSVRNFREGRIDPYLVAYYSSCVFTERTPGGMGGEQWRGTFLTEPPEALATVMHFVRG